jgi:hypothetical protein
VNVGCLDEIGSCLCEKKCDGDDEVVFNKVVVLEDEWLGLLFVFICCDVCVGVRLRLGRKRKDKSKGSQLADCLA